MRVVWLCDGLGESVKARLLKRTLLGVVSPFMVSASLSLSASWATLSAVLLAISKRALLSVEATNCCGLITSVGFRIPTTVGKSDAVTDATADGENWNADAVLVNTAVG